MDPLGLVILGALLLSIVLGILKVRSELVRLGEERNRAEEFLELLKGYWESRGKDTVAYAHLVARSPRIQMDLGALGLADYKPPGAGYMIRNYQLVVNLIPEIKTWIGNQDHFFGTNPALEAAQTVQEAIFRHLGIIDDRSELHRKTLRSPLELLNLGIRSLLFFPLYVLASLGIFTRSSIRSLQRTNFAKVLAGIVSLISIVSGIITLVLGWEQFVAIAFGWFAN